VGLLKEGKKSDVVPGHIKEPGAKS